MSITRKFISLALALLVLALPARAQQMPQGDDLVMGYLAADGAVLNPFLCNERDLVSVNQLVFESVVERDSQQKPAPQLADNWTVDGYDLIPCRLSSTDSKNDYRPRPYKEDEEGYARALSKLDGSWTGSDLNVDYSFMYR